MFIDMKNAYSEAADSIANAYSMMGVSREDILKGTADFEKNMDMMKLILPGCILASGILMSFINFKLTRLVLKRINYMIEDVKSYSLWRLSNKWLIFIMSMLLYAIVEIYLIKLPQLYALTMNIFTVTMILLLVLGLSVAKFFLDKYTIPKAVKGIILFLLLIAFSNIVMLISIFDILFDFRKLGNKPAEGV
jgi:uncharacterized protein YybS (DUF2232 family)